MILRRLGVQNFRNIAEAGLEFEPGNTFLLGANGQGKSNLIEAIGFMTALRAFRTHDQRPVIRHGEEEAALAFVVDRDGHGRTDLTIRLRAQGRSVEVDGEPVRRLADLIGQLPTVIFASEDIQLIRGGPSLRRRLVDLFLSSLDAGYLTALMRYHRALRERNALLKQEADDGQLAAFEQVMAPAADRIARARADLATGLSDALQTFYAGLCDGEEEPGLQFRPDGRAENEADWLELLRDGRLRDRQMRATQRGPHRDDFRLQLNRREAQDYASEGQQRGLVLALRFAQLRVIRERTGVVPIVLADDVLGELDPVRRERFWCHLDSDTQVIASGTTGPNPDDPRDWRVLQVEAGRFAEKPTG